MKVLLPAGTHAVGDVVELDEDESHHLRVRRAEAGEPVELRDGAGLVGQGVLSNAGRAWSVRIESARLIPPLADLVLAVGAGDRDRFGWLVEKAAELGVTELVPLETERTAGVATRVRPAHIEKLARRARETLKQSGSAWATSVAQPVALSQFLARPLSGERWLADPDGASPPAVGGGPVAILIGPEGGFTGQEHAAARSAGWAPVRFASAVLRFETAALAAAAGVAAARERMHQ